MFDIKPQTLQYWYKNFLSDYVSDINDGKWHPQKIEIVDKCTDEIKEGGAIKRKNTAVHLQ